MTSLHLFQVEDSVGVHVYSAPDVVAALAMHYEYSGLEAGFACRDEWELCELAPAEMLTIHFPDDSTNRSKTRTAVEWAAVGAGFVGSSYYV